MTLLLLFQYFLLLAIDIKGYMTTSDSEKDREGDEEESPNEDVVDAQGHAFITTKGAG